MDGLFDKFKYYQVDEDKEVHGMAHEEEGNVTRLKDIVLRAPNLMGSVVKIKDQFYKIEDYLDETENSVKYDLYFYKIKNITQSYKNKLKFKNSLKIK